jgi:hypothetical protein
VCENFWPPKTGYCEDFIRNQYGGFVIFRIHECFAFVTSVNSKDQTKLRIEIKIIRIEIKIIRSEIKIIRSEIKIIRREIKIIRSEIKIIRREIKISSF